LLQRQAAKAPDGAELVKGGFAVAERCAPAARTLDELGWPSGIGRASALKPALSSPKEA
jgi:hypothetical protein